MRGKPGPTFVPALIALAVGGAVLFLSEATWLRLASSLVMLGGLALAAFAIATPDFLARDVEDAE
jgi:hypothetical protein